MEEIIASLFEAVVYQNLGTLTKGNTPTPDVLLLGGPNLFFRGLQEAWRHHLGKLWKERKIDADPGLREFRCRRRRVYYACLGCIEIATGEARSRPLHRPGKACAGGSRKDSGKRRRRTARRAW